MYGRYAVEKEQKTLLFTITQNQSVDVEFIEMGMNLRPDEVIFDDTTILIKSTFFIMPDVIHETRLTWDGGQYEVAGSYAMFGDAAGIALPFKGRTKYEIMAAELPLYRTKKAVERSEEEIQAQVDRLLSRMTLQEKIGQMSQGVGRNVAAIGVTGEEVISEAEAIGRGMVGSVITMTGPGVVFEQQKNAVENARLGIPLMFCQDVIHGYETIFPIPLAWSCSFNPKLLEKAMSVAAKEATTQGVMYAFSPMLDISRDPRWGRVSEGNGEDPFLASRMAEAHIKGFQGEDLSKEDTMLACMKHFIGYSAAEGGRDYNTTEISDSTLYNIYARPFQAGVDAGAASIMNAFNVLNGVPAVGNKQLCHDLLRDKMNFEGMLLSDFGAVDELIVHGVAEDGEEAAKKAFEASLDIEMGICNYHKYLESLVGAGVIAEVEIDKRVRRILAYKYKLGIMDDPFKYLRPEQEDLLFCPDHLNVSYDLAKESTVLLKNDGVLPLKSGKKLALIGPIGDATDLFGPWQFSKREDDTATIKERMAAAGFLVAYEKGSGIDWTIEGGIDRAADIIKDVDVVVLALGETKGMCGEAASRQNITIPKAQMELAMKVHRTASEHQKPVVLLLTNGRPLLLDWMDENMNAILETWFLGSQAAEVIVDTLTGEVNPSGKLAMTFPKHQGQIPIYYNALRTGRPYVEGSAEKFLSKYLDGCNEPLYSFGYGLSYTDFVLEDVAIDRNIISMGEIAVVSARVKNTGDREGAEVVQLYCWDVAAEIARPIKELIGFEKVNLQPQESKEILFTIDAQLLSYYNHNYERVLEPGRVMLYVGTSSNDVDLTEVELYVKENDKG